MQGNHRKKQEHTEGRGSLEIFKPLPSSPSVYSEFFSVVLIWGHPLAGHLRDLRIEPLFHWRAERRVGIGCRADELPASARAQVLNAEANAPHEAHARQRIGRVVSLRIVLKPGIGRVE